jgi:hypothetical protein
MNHQCYPVFEHLHTPPPLPSKGIHIEFFLWQGLSQATGEVQFGKFAHKNLESIDVS